MKKTVKPIPRGYHAVTPYLSVKGAASAIGFYKKAFAAKEIMRMPAPGGTIGHAEIQIEDSHIMTRRRISGYELSRAEVVRRHIGAYSSLRPRR